MPYNIIARYYAHTLPLLLRTNNHYQICFMQATQRVEFHKQHVPRTIFVYSMPFTDRSKYTVMHWNARHFG